MGLLRRRTLESPKRSAMLHFPILQTLAAQPLPGSSAFWQAFLGNSVCPLTLGNSFTAFAFIRKRDVFFSGFVILMCSTCGQKTRYGLPQFPSVEQYF